MKHEISLDAVKIRKSVRTFTGESLTEKDKTLIKEYLENIDNLSGIHGNTIKIRLIETKDRAISKIGTYGIIKNAPAYLVVTSVNTKDAMFDCGYVVERFLLFLADHGLGTCWLGGTFNRSKLTEQIQLSEDEMVPIITPVGYGHHKRSLSDKLIRNLAKGDDRLDFDGLFFKDAFNQGIKDQELRETLENVRLAPSASNKQPWRVLVDSKGNAHFYIKRTPNYAGEKLGYDIQWLDMGIAASHYELALKNLSFRVEEPILDGTPQDFEYVITGYSVN
ncbi:MULTISPECIES: nitroreductase family protein [unclassified Fusibacter]|uniref:nitroreductase family protein n=1 Tax=unclassified Fusibacter TaxID=2624464 RepID=UPI0010124CF6|nr:MULTISPECIES: nitroreductase family protein [unclassified Fusibacter]MCK8060748.1 nitroreductase family protein [Fusibacter sp. A2]NPE23044.1 nitroreductase [Fusibacter sp. A1]RXV59716.1 nitroreductase [Fusibacter sp. A1]